jgi:hypothetical protein
MGLLVCAARQCSQQESGGRMVDLPGTRTEPVLHANSTAAGMVVLGMVQVGIAAAWATHSARLQHY